jgi:ComF family protein
VNASDSAGWECGQCRQEAQEFDLARSFGPYAGKLRVAILQLKFHRRERLGKRLGGLLASVWLSVEEFREAEAPLLVPVPLHPSRERERGFNQAELLAQGLSLRLGEASKGRGPAVDSRCLLRTRATVPQTGLSLEARRENVRAVFAVAKPQSVRGRVVALVDDVMTTGATLSACARALKRAGARQVLAITLAHATPQIPDVESTRVRSPVDDIGATWA